MMCSIFNSGLANVGPLSAGPWGQASAVPLMQINHIHGNE